MSQSGQIIDVWITGNGNNPISALQSNTLQQVEMFDFISDPLLITDSRQPLIYGLGTLDPYHL